MTRAVLFGLDLGLRSEANSRMTRVRIKVNPFQAPSPVRLRREVAAANSVRHRSKEAYEIHVSAQRNAQTGQSSSRDNGIGIASQDADRVFGMCKPLHGKETPGTGAIPARNFTS